MFGGTFLVLLTGETYLEDLTVKHLIATFALLLASQSVLAAQNSVNMNDPKMNPTGSQAINGDACNKRAGGSRNTLIRANGTSAPADSKSLARARSNASA